MACRQRDTSVVNVLVILFRSLTNQTMNRNNCSTLLLFNWILTISVLTKCFVSVLLGIYSTKTFVPLVNTLDDVFDKNGIRIAIVNMSNVIHEYNEIQQSIDHKSIERHKQEFADITANEWRDYSFVLKDSFVKEVMSGKVVVIMETKLMNSLGLMLTQRYKRLAVIDNKYLPMYSTVAIDGQHVYYRNIEAKYTIHKLRQWLRFDFFSELKFVSKMVSILLKIQLEVCFTDLWPDIPLIRMRTTSTRHLRSLQLDYSISSTKRSFRWYSAYFALYFYSFSSIYFSPRNYSNN